MSKLRTFSPSQQKRDTSIYIEEPKFNSLINICSELYEMENRGDRESSKIEKVDNCLISTFNKSLNLNMDTDDDLVHKKSLSICDCCYSHTSSKRSYVSSKRVIYLHEEYKGIIRLVM